MGGAPPPWKTSQNHFQQKVKLILRKKNFRLFSSFFVFFRPFSSFFVFFRRTRRDEKRRCDIWGGGLKDPHNQDFDFYLANIEGLVTKKRNKCAQLNTYTTGESKNRIIALTETWSKDCYVEEYKKYFPGFHIERTDRDTSYDDKALKSRGGCMVLTGHES